MGWAAAIPAVMSAVGSIAKAATPAQGGGGQAQAPMPSMMQANPFPMNMPDGGKPPGTPSILAYGVGGDSSASPYMPGHLMPDGAETDPMNGVGAYLNRMFS